MTPEQLAELDKVAAERAGNLQQETKPLTLESVHARLTAVENHPALSIPALETREADGSGTGRYGEHGNWTQVSDGTDYPGSYGVGKRDGVGSVGQELKPFLPTEEERDAAKKELPPFVPFLETGDSVRVIGADGQVDPAIHKVVGVGTESVAVDDGNSYPHDKVVAVIPESVVEDQSNG
jgi:hypothetical protein